MTTTVQTIVCLQRLTVNPGTLAAGKYPGFNERGSPAVISALGRRDIEVKLTSVVAGEYELVLTLANGAAKAVKLKVAEAELRRAPGASRKSPEAQPEPRAR